MPRPNPFIHIRCHRVRLPVKMAAARTRAIQPTIEEIAGTQ
ncbi:hypothetical protein D805_0082 [Bifidobacterium thermophilum RBL67]|uniref:Uncharacterized protein n=1 Tax=Bifidobacterium thermophilum RBL67 TaxID=1254439 RepID=M4RDV3_9BIFI|nr:hypothetical protein D805_0082 [Bifidobacterium thermophilum RBL67]